MNNQITWEQDGDHILVRVPIKGSTRPSSTGKSNLLATESIKVPGTMPQVTVQITARQALAA